MASNEKALELKVGLFVIVGLCVIATMVLKFGRLGQAFGKTYDIKVELPDASGLIKDADVKMAGAKIGLVGEKPEILSNVSGVAVTLKINESVKIPRKMKFQVGSSGLLGDRFVEIVGGDDFDPTKFNSNDAAQILQPGDRVKGGEPGGLDLLTRKGQVVMDKGREVLEKLTAEIEDLRVTTAKVNDGILSDANQKNLSAMLLNLKTTSDSFVETSKHIDTVVQSAQGAVDTAKQTMTTVNSAAGDLRVTIDEARKTMTAAKGIMVKATQGNGLIATLLNDHELAENLKTLISNLRQRGLLFYKDLSKKAEN